jgi:glycosyltransferase involved in cell wall biosynthesis
VANSTRGREDLLALGVPAKQIEVVFNAIQPDPRLRGLDRNHIRRSWGANPGDLVLASIGNLTEPKNFPLLVGALRDLRAAGCPVKGVVYGEGPQRRELESLIDGAGLTGRVLLCGQVPDARVLVAAADVFVLTSWGEGMANALLEGAAAGLPLVTTAVGGAEDVVLEGETGFLVPINDRKALVDAVQRLADNPEKRLSMGRRARELVLRSFCQTSMVERFQNVYERVLAEKRRVVGPP